MKKRKFIVPILALSLFASSFTAYASTKISTVKIKIDTEDTDTTEIPDLDISTNGKGYDFDSYEITGGFESLYDDEDEEDTASGPGAESKTNTKKTTSNSEKKEEVATVEITLTANDDYVFNTMSKDKIKVSGYGAECTKASRKDSGKTLVLTVKLPDLKLRLGEVSEAGWESESKGRWNKADNAASYSLRLYRDGKPFGHIQETGGITYDFAPYMLKAGNYHYIVRPVSDSGDLGERVESTIINVSEETAQGFKQTYALQYDDTVDMKGPHEMTPPINVGWQEEDGEYWYRCEDGTFPQTQWLQVDENWYFFDSDGHMVKNQWVRWKGKEYYFGNDGSMLVNVKTPDGYKVGSDGAKK